MKKILFLVLLLIPSVCWGQFATTMDSSDVAGWKFTTFTDVDDSLKAGYQIYQKIDTTSAVIDSAVGAERAVVSGKADSALAFTHDGIKDWHIDWGSGAGQVNLDDFDDQTAWQVLYTNTDGDVTELALGADGTYLKSNGASSAPTFATPPGGDPGSAINDSIMNGWQIYQKIDTTDAVIDSSVGAERATTTLKADSALAFTHQGIKKYHTDSTSENFAFDGAYHITSGEADSAYLTHGGAAATYLTGNESITLSGDATGSGATAITVTVVDDLHNHVYSNIDPTTSVNWATRVSDETGAGLLVFGTSPTFTTDITSPLVIGGTATTSDLSLKTTSGVGEAGADMHFLVGSNGGTEAMTILNNGDVGIGTTSPNEHLEVSGTGDQYIQVNSTDGATPGIKLIDAGSENYDWRARVAMDILYFGYSVDDGSSWYSSLYFGGLQSSPQIRTFSSGADLNLGAGDDIVFQTYSTGWDERMRITAAGDVGINTTIPDEKLHITDNNAALKLEDDSGNDAMIKVGNSQLCIAADPDDLVASSDICLDIDGSEVARFHSSTNFGIGTLSPPERISVVGNVATGDSTTGDVDVYHYFSTDNSWVTEYLKWDDGNGRFEFSDDLYLSGTVLSSDTLTKSFVIASPDATFDFPFWQTKRAITIVAVSAVCTGGTNVIGALDEYNATGTAVDAVVDGDWTITTSEYTDASFTNPGIDAGDWLGFHTTSVSGSVTFFSITFEYTEQ